MIIYHKLEEVPMDLTEVISGHSADQVVDYKTVNEEAIRMGFYLPADFGQYATEPDKKHPIIILIHGGGWAGHQIFPEQAHWQGDYLGYLARYYAEKGILGVSIDYRRIKENGQLPEYGVLECYEDCCDAIDYIIAHAEEYHVDINRMYLLGESAGGHLAGALSTFHYDRRYQFNKVFLLNPVTDMNARLEKVPAHKENILLADMDLKQRATFLSPLFQADADTNDTVLVHGACDTVVDQEQSFRFYERLKELKRTCELHIIEETGHAFMLPEYYKDTRACRIGIRIIDQILGI